MKNFILFTVVLLSTSLKASDNTKRHLQDLPQTTVNAADDFGIYATIDSIPSKDKPAAPAHNRPITDADFLLQD